jgi:4-amino-4-deoxy-L-arabinose transferase-like glycosyltransferase
MSSLFCIVHHSFTLNFAKQRRKKNNIYGHNEDKYKNNSLTILVVIAVMSSQIIWSPILILKIEFTIKRNTKNLKIVILHLNVNNMKNL